MSVRARVDDFFTSYPLLSLLKDNVNLRAFAFFRIPLIAFVRPRIVHFGDNELEVKIPLNYFTKNHWGSMYFGVLAVGADLCIGLLAMRKIEQASGAKISLIFKDFHIEFLKRPEADTHFYCDAGSEISAMIQETVRTGERVTKPISGVAKCPSKLGDEVVAKFTLGLSLKSK